ncbi:MAG: permease [Persicimonas sp.]
MELWLSILALAVGPALFPLAKRRPRLLCGIDGFVLVSIGGLCLFHLMPVAVEHGGMWTLVTALAGLLFPFVFGGHQTHDGQRNVHNAFLLLAAGGLAIHALIDGAALFQGVHHELLGNELGGLVAAVLIHRVPMSLLVWWSVSPRMGKWPAAATLILLAVATVIGYQMGGVVEMTPPLTGHLVAFVAGSLFHVVAHDTTTELIPRHCHDAWHATYSGLGGALAAAGLVAFGDMHEAADHAHTHAPALDWHAFLSLFVTASPALLIGFTLGGLMEAGFGRTVLSKFRGKSNLTSALRGIVRGTPIPICSCGVKTVYRVLFLRGVPVAASVAFLVAAPGMTLDSIALSVELLGVELTIARVIGVLVVAVGAALAVARVADTSESPGEANVDIELDDDESLAERAGESLRLGWVEQVDHAAPWIIVGFAATALMWPALEGGLLADAGAAVETVALTLAAAPAYLNVTAMTAVGGALIAHGVAASAVVAMLVASSSLSIPTLLLVGRLHGKRALAAMLLAGLGLIIAMAAALHLGAGELTAPMSAAVFEGDHGPVEWGAAALLAALFLLSYLRMGPREMIGQLLPFDHHHLHDHGHHEHEHTHGDHGHHEGA